MAATLAATVGLAPLSSADAAKPSSAQTETQKAKKKKASAAASAPRECKTAFECWMLKKTGRVQNASVQSGGVKASRNVLRGTTRQTVSWTEDKYKPGSIIVRTPERALYLVMDDGKALRYKVGVGREGFQWGGSSRIVNKAEWPDWRPPARMIEREAAKGVKLPAFMPGGPNNPLGARALYIGGTIFRIHGTNNAASIGGAVSSGCIRMMNEDVIDLYDRVNVGARVYVYQ
jgi:lipoprotein-anchoring transpeptidase ErfK/SrfK